MKFISAQDAAQLICEAFGNLAEVDSVAKMLDKRAHYLRDLILDNWVTCEKCEYWRDGYDDYMSDCPMHCIGDEYDFCSRGNISEEWALAEIARRERSRKDGN